MNNPKYKHLADYVELVGVLSYPENRNKENMDKLIALFNLAEVSGWMEDWKAMSLVLVATSKASSLN